MTGLGLNFRRVNAKMVRGFAYETTSTCYTPATLEKCVSPMVVPVPLLSNVDKLSDLSLWLLCDKNRGGELQSTDYILLSIKQRTSRW